MLWTKIPDPSTWNIFVRFSCRPDKHRRKTRTLKLTWYNVLTINLLSHEYLENKYICIYIYIYIYLYIGARFYLSVEVCRWYLLNWNANSCQSFCCSQKQPSSVYGNRPRSIWCMRSLNTCILTLGFEFHNPKIVTRMWVAPLNAKPIIIYQQKCYSCIPSWYLVKCYHVQQIPSWWTCSHPYVMRLAMVRGTRQSSVSAQVCTVRYKYTLLCFVVVCFRWNLPTSELYGLLWSHAHPPPPPTHTHHHLKQP